jgi:hypothetical protein
LYYNAKMAKVNDANAGQFEPPFRDQPVGYHTGQRKQGEWIMFLHVGLGTDQTKRNLV